MFDCFSRYTPDGEFGHRPERQLYAISQLDFERALDLLREHDLPEYEVMTHAQLAEQHGVADSSIRHTHAGALRRLRRDDELFDALEAVGKVRDRARRLQLHRDRPAA